MVVMQVAFPLVQKKNKIKKERDENVGDEISGLGTRESGSVVAGRRHGQGGHPHCPHCPPTSPPTRAAQGCAVRPRARIKKPEKILGHKTQFLRLVSELGFLFPVILAGAVASFSMNRASRMGIVAWRGRRAMRSPS